MPKDKNKIAEIIREKKAQKFKDVVRKSGRDEKAKSLETFEQKFNKETKELSK